MIQKLWDDVEHPDLDESAFDAGSTIADAANKVANFVNQSGFLAQGIF
jgi:hypothetical protein